MRWKTHGWSPLSLCSHGLCLPSRRPTSPPTSRCVKLPPCLLVCAHELRPGRSHAHDARAAPTCALAAPSLEQMEFEKGDPVAIDGVRMSPATLLTKLNELGGKNGEL